MSGENKDWEMGGVQIRDARLVHSETYVVCDRGGKPLCTRTVLTLEQDIPEESTSGQRE